MSGRVRDSKEGEAAAAAANMGKKDGGDCDHGTIVMIVMLLIMAMGLSFASSASAAAASSQLRRNLLANGLGLTPPMG